MNWKSTVHISHVWRRILCSG